MGELISLLIYLAEKGAVFQEVTLSTINISKETKISQQTVSRKLMQIEKEGLIARAASTRGIKIKLTEKGMEMISGLYRKLRDIFEEKMDFINGTVESGLGEGSYYVSLNEYEEQFRNKLGIMPFKGTLNVRVNYSEFIRFVSSQRKIIIDGFKAGGRTFGQIIAYKVKLNNLDAAIVVPERTSHDRDIIEIISEFKLRKKLSLKDGDKVEVVIR